ncbi:MAG: carbonic anhydrase [Planctomycetota bacterium]
MTLHDSIDQSVNERENWALRRRRGIPNNKRLFVLTCMDERIPVERILGLELGDAHIYRNAGALVTDDVIRSAALTTNFFGTQEIIILLHTECGMLTTTGEQVVEALTTQLAERGIDINEIDLDPAIPGLSIPQQDLANWFRTFQDVDEAAVEQVRLLRDHPLILEGVTIHAYIYETESDTLRRPQARIAEQTSTSPPPVLSTATAS